MPSQRHLLLSLISHATFPGAVFDFHEAAVDHLINTFNHGGQHIAWVNVVLVGIDTNTQFAFSLMACNAPMPLPPAAAKITSTPRSICARASSPPLAGSFHAAVVVPTIFCTRSVFASVAFAPCA